MAGNTASCREQGERAGAMIGDTLTPNLYEMRVAWALLRVCRGFAPKVDFDSKAFVLNQKSRPRGLGNF